MRTETLRGDDRTSRVLTKVVPTISVRTDLWGSEGLPPDLGEIPVVDPSTYLLATSVLSEIQEEFREKADETWWPGVWTYLNFSYSVIWVWGDEAP